MKLSYAAFALLPLLLSVTVGSSFPVEEYLKGHPEVTPSHDYIQALIDSGDVATLKAILDNRHYERHELFPNVWAPFSKGDHATMDVLHEHGLLNEETMEMFLTSHPPEDIK
jgi:hypothetical protein